ncbi:MAG: GAF domain-containing protein, partial [Acidobacteria bacterium]|nr:GAF domain-containing protein [Acidobacteriota bacterium]
MRPSASQPEEHLPKAPDSSQLRITHWMALAEASKILNSTLDLDRLLELILEVATHELGAERGTVYLLDKQAGELRARISQGLETRLLRVKVGQGLAGKAAQTGETIRSRDAYQDARFFPDIDATSGFRTRSILCTPIRNKSGEVIGVIELLNKVKGTFDIEDEIFLQALTVHIAIALENAKLHAALVDQERIRTELELARQIQQNLLRPPPERWRNYRMAAKADPCYEVG